MATKMVILASGGLDSTVLIAWAQAHDFAVEALSIHYGQRHACEMVAAGHITRTLQVSWKSLAVSTILPILHGSALTDPTIPVPHGHYTDTSMRATIVPNRNMVLLSLAAAYAISLGAYTVGYACHAGDHAIYPDCRPAFVRAMEQVFLHCHHEPLALLVPFLHWTKTDIVREGVRLGVPLALTWSCYEGGAKHCGRCGSCVERQMSFREAAVADPTEYAHALDAA